MALSRDRAEYIALLEHTLTRLVATLARMEEVERVSTFGSYARGRRDLLTDLDILRRESLWTECACCTNAWLLL